MAGAKKRRGGAKRSRKKASMLKHLKPAEAETVLHRLLDAHPDLRAEAGEIAESLLGEVSFESVADGVEDAVQALDIDDLGNRAGRHRQGYTSPTEAAWEILEETVEPFREDIKRLKALGLEAEALETCKGVVLGLYRVRDGKGNDLLEWAADFPVEAAADAVAAWYAGGKGRGARKRPTFPRDFVAKFIPEWDPLIAHAAEDLEDAPGTG